jgi:hypothetical protein
MEVGNLLGQKLTANARSMIDKLGKFKIAFTLSSSSYCAIHWLVSHNFSTSESDSNRHSNAGTNWFC